MEAAKAPAQFFDGTGAEANGDLFVNPTDGQLRAPDAIYRLAAELVKPYRIEGSPGWTGVQRALKFIRQLCYRLTKGKDVVVGALDLYLSYLIANYGLYKPARAASLSSTRWINLVKPHFSSFSFSIHVVWSMDKFSHLTSYSYLFFFWRREMIFSTTNFMTVPSSLVTLIFSFINFSSSGVYCMVTLVKFSLSSPV